MGSIAHLGTKRHFDHGKPTAWPAWPGGEPMLSAYQMASLTRVRQWRVHGTITDFDETRDENGAPTPITRDFDVTLPDRSAYHVERYILGTDTDAGDPHPTTISIVLPENTEHLWESMIYAKPITALPGISSSFGPWQGGEWAHDEIVTIEDETFGDVVLNDFQMHLELNAMQAMHESGKGTTFPDVFWQTNHSEKLHCGLQLGIAGTSFSRDSGIQSFLEFGRYYPQDPDTPSDSWGRSFDKACTIKWLGNSVPVDMHFSVGSGDFGEDEIGVTNVSVTLEAVKYWTYGGKYNENTGAPVL